MPVIILDFVLDAFRTRLERPLKVRGEEAWNSPPPHKDASTTRGSPSVSAVIEREPLGSGEAGGFEQREELLVWVPPDMDEVERWEEMEGGRGANEVAAPPDLMVGGVGTRNMLLGVTEL